MATKATRREIELAAAKRRRAVEQAGGYDEARRIAAAKKVAAENGQGVRPNRGRAVEEVRKEIDDGATDSQATTATAGGREQRSAGAAGRVAGDLATGAGRAGPAVRRARAERPQVARASVGEVAAKLAATDNPNFHTLDPAPPTGYQPDPVTLVRALPARFAALGIEDAGRRPAELLATAERLAVESRTQQQEAHASLAEAMADLAAGRIGLSEVAAVTRQVAAWIDHDAAAGRVAPAQAVVMQTVDQLQRQAVQTLNTEALMLYTRLQTVAQEAVGVIAGGPEIPNEVMIAPDARAAATAAGSTFAHWFVDAEGAARRYAECHELARILREHVGGLGAAVVWPSYCPSEVGPVWRNWEKAVADDAQHQRRRYRSLVCWIRYAHDQGWEPGLWLAQDLVAKPKPKPGLLQRVTGG